MVKSDFMIKNRYIGYCIAACLVMLILSTVTGFEARAEGDRKEQKIAETGYLYNIYNEPEYTFTTFENGGYKICRETTGETIEYSAAGILPYEADEKKYYNGPLNYLRKDGNFFYDIVNCGGNRSGTPDKNFDKGKIYVSDPGISGLKKIDNDYFSVAPTYGVNVHGTCGSVATQILLSYNNYYYDRRIIAPEYLNGGWKGETGSDRFDPSNYIESEKDPNVCYDPREMTSGILGTNEAFYKRVISEAEPGALTCTDTITRIVIDKERGVKWKEITVKNIKGEIISNKVTDPEPLKEGDKADTIIDHSHSGSDGKNLENAIKAIINSSVQYNINRKFNLFGLNEEQIGTVKNEINQNRATILGMQGYLGGSDHYVVTYGYADYTNSATGVTSKGFIADCGWGEGSHDIWLNASWCSEYLTLKIDHEHKYTEDTGKTFGYDKREVRCKECGHRMLDDLYSIDEEGNLKAKYEMIGDVFIPKNINGQDIKGIRDRAFADMGGLTSVRFEDNRQIKSIGIGAFENCSQLSCFNTFWNNYFELPLEVENIGSSAFRGTAFEYINLQSNVMIDVASGVFENCIKLRAAYIYQNITSIGYAVFRNCNALKSVTFSESLTNIYGEAFANCTSLLKLKIPLQVEYVGTRAFKGCSSLERIEFLSIEKQTEAKSLRMANGAFADCTGLKNLVIPEFVTSLGNGAFENVNLNTVYYDGSRAAYAKLKANSSANDNFFNADTYFYSANKPFSGTNYWRYDSEGNPEIWPSKQLQGITANGESRAVTTDAIVITFDSDPGENFGVNNVYTNGANVDAVSGSGTTRVVTVSDVTVRDGEKLKLELKPAGDYYFVNPEIEVAVCVKVCKIFYYEAGKNFFSGDISDCPTEYMEGQTTKLGTPMRFGFEFDGWHLNEDGSGERIYNITPDYRGDITLYAKWKSYDRLPWDSEHIKVMYYTENAETPLDMLFKSEGGLGESSYYIREALFPALAQLNADGYGYELNSTLISEFYPSDDKVSARIVLNDGLKFSSDNDLTANDFKAYYDFIVNAYEDLPEPWKYISGVVANDSRALEITLTRSYDIMYVLSELRAADSELLGELSGMTTEAANACVYAKAADVVTYGRYKIGEISEMGGILLMPNEKYTFYNENSAYDITLYICGDFQEAGAKYFRGETDACYNLNEEDILDILGNEELHAYDDRVRMYLGLNKDSTALAQYGEADKQKIIYALGLLIDYDRINTKFGGAEHENNKWFPDGYPFEGMPADDGFDNEWISCINYQSDIADRQAKARMIFDTLGINPEEFELTLTVKNKRRYTELAAILQSSFEAIGMRLVVNVVATDDETNGGDLLFVFYDFTGKVIADEDFLEKDNLNLIFSPCGYDEEAIIRRLTEKYEEAETETEKQEILGEIQSIMAFYAVKINHINKYYLARPEYFEFTNGHPANLVY